MISINQGLESLLTRIAFRSNPLLRPSGTVIEYTPEMIDELVKCKKDVIYFVKKYVKIVHVDRGLVPFELYPYQEKMIRAYADNRKVISTLFRQAGKTTTTAAFICWYILFNDEKTCAILANKAATAREILQRVETAYQYLPKWMQSGIVSWNKGSMELENGSRVIASATSSSGIRGFSISLLYLDEFAHVESGVAEEFFTAVFPTLSSGKDTKILISSTPNGFNLYKKFWDDAVLGTNGFVPLRFDWWEHPDRDQKWADEQRAVLGELKYSQEVLMEFLGSSMTLLDGATLRKMTAIAPIKTFKDQYFGLKIYQPPKKEHKYVMTVDVSRGRHLDASAFMVIDVTDYPHRIVASYNNSNIAPLMYAGVIYQLAVQYNNAYVLIEINDVGAQVAEELYYTYEYGEMFWTKSGDVLGKQGADPYPGIRTTKKTKRIGCANLKDIIERTHFIVDDALAISELSTFTQNKAGSYEADLNCHDDMCTCLWLYAWLAIQPWFNDLFDASIRNAMYEAEISRMEEDLLFGEFSDGTETYSPSESPEELGMKHLL